MTDVSVVVPVYNKAPYLPELIDSLKAQRGVDFDVWLIDDGSTDDCPRLCDAAAASDPRFHTIHQPNSGWPGRPRNVGIRRSTGRFLFFADADDWLEPDALADLVAFADRYTCDVTLPLVGHDQHAHGATDPGSTSPPPLDLRLAFRSLTPHKLFRRNYLADHDLWFTEQRVPLEDGRLVARAYTAGGRVGRFADRVCYHYMGREGSNISYGPRDPGLQSASVADIISSAQRSGDADAAADITADLYRRKMLRYVGSDLLTRMDPAVAARWVSVVADFADQTVSPQVEQRLAVWPRLVSRMTRRRDAAANLRLVHQRQQECVPLTGSHDGWLVDGIPVTGIDVAATVRRTAGEARIAVRLRPKWLAPTDVRLHVGGRTVPTVAKGRRWVARIPDTAGGAPQVLIGDQPVDTAESD